MQTDDHNNTGMRKRRFKSVLIVLACVLIALTLAVVLFVNGIFSKISRFDGTDSTMSSEEMEAYLATAEGADLDSMGSMMTEPSEFDIMSENEEWIGGDIINIMLVGQDTRKAEKRGLSDTMILVSINRETKKMVMTSFLRDLYIDLVNLETGKTYRNRLNTAYCVGGIEQLGKTLALNFGVEIDNFVEVDFNTFTEIVDELGGIDIELTKTEAGYIGVNNGWKLQEGMNHLNGAQTLVYARVRKIDSDFHRTERQRKVMTILFEKIRSMDVVEIMNLADQFLPMVTTDMTNSEITQYILQLIPLLPELEIESLRIPIDGTWSGMNVGTEESPRYVIGCRDLTANREALRNAVGE